MKKLIWLLPISLALLVASCLKDDLDKTVVLLGTESDVQPIDSVISDTLLTFLMDTTVLKNSLPVGNMPPDVQGEYVFGPRELYKHNHDDYYIYQEGDPNDTVYFRFGGDYEILSFTDSIYLEYSLDTITPDSIVNVVDTIHVQDSTYYYPEGQHNMRVSVDIKEPNLPLKTVEDAFVMGTNKSFTVYFAVNYENLINQDNGGTYSIKRGYVITGTIADDGIEQAVLACVDMESSLADQFNIIMVYRVHSDDHQKPFDTAKRKKWYHKN